MAPACQTTAGRNTVCPESGPYDAEFHPAFTNSFRFAFIEGQ
jgi:hypothetical protein